MATNPVDQYLAGLTQPQRATLTKVRDSLAAILPGAEQTMSYGMPAFKVDGTAIAGFAAFKKHCSFFPHSGQVIPKLKGALRGYYADGGTLRFPIDKALPISLLRKLVKERLRLESETITAGKVRAFYANGTLKYHGQKKEGQMHGSWRWYRQDGSLMRSGAFKLGRQVGNWSSWDRNGRLVKETRKG